MKKIFNTLIVLLILATLAYGGFRLINRYTKKRLLELEKEAVKVVPLASMQPRKINLPDLPKAEKESLMYLKTDKESYKIGDSFELQVFAKAQGEKVDGAEFVLNFDPKLVFVAEVQKGTFFTLYPQQKIDNQNGMVRVIALQKPDANKVLNEELVAILKAKALGRGTASFIFDQTKTHIAGYGGQELLQDAAPLKISLD